MYTGLFLRPKKHLNLRAHSKRVFSVALFIIVVVVVVLTIFTRFSDWDDRDTSFLQAIPVVGIALSGGLLLSGAVMYYIARFVFIYLNS